MDCKRMGVLPLTPDKLEFNSFVFSLTRSKSMFEGDGHDTSSDI